MKRKRSVLILAILIIVGMTGCKTVSKYTDEPTTKESLNIKDYSNPLNYSLHIAYFNQNDIGITESIDEISAKILKADYKGDTYINWMDYQVRSFTLNKDSKIENTIEFPLINEDDAADWNSIEYANDFDYLLDNSSSIVENGQLTGIPDTTSIPRDMTGFQFYMNIIDFHTMADIYIGMIMDTESPFYCGTNGMHSIGDTFSLSEEGHLLDLMNWENISTDLFMEGGQIFAEYTGKGEFNGKETKIIYFQQNQRLNQNIYGPLAGNLLFKMKYNGTNRFVGYLEVTDDNTLVRAFFNEYVYGKVYAPFFVKVLVHSKREYKLELIL